MGTESPVNTELEDCKTEQIRDMCDNLSLEENVPQEPESRRQSMKPFVPIFIDGVPVIKPRGSLASRRTSAAVSNLEKKGSLKLTLPDTLQPPKLETLGLPRSHGVSPMSATIVPNFNVTNRDKLLKENILPEWLSNLVSAGEKSCTQIHESFKKIEHLEAERLHNSPFSTQFSCSVAHLKENAKRNRYSDIVPFDRNRVLLNNESQDYINASLVQSKYLSKKFIVSQGPLQSTMANFWKMIWEQNVSVIVMLTLEEENGRQKCHGYWPKSYKEHLALEQSNGLLRVEWISHESVDDEMTLTELMLTDGTEERKIYHAHFMAWPDYRVGSPESILNAIEFVRKLETSSGPTLVHCSAGCGRAGTYCTIDTLLSAHELVRSSSQDLVYQIVDDFRTQRMSMVQTFEQFVFCYEVLVHWISRQY